MPEDERRPAALSVLTAKNGNGHYTTEQMIRAIRDTKGMTSFAAKRLNCSAETVRNYCRRYPTVAQAMREEREAMLDVAELSLFTAIQEREAWAVCFFLKTIGRERGYIERHEVGGEGGGPIIIEVVRGSDQIQGAAPRPALLPARNRR